MDVITVEPLSMTFSDAAAGKVKKLIAEEENDNLKLRVFVTGGGCSGFEYGFTFDEDIEEESVFWQRCIEYFPPS